MAELVVSGLARSYGTIPAIQDVTFTIADGEFVTLLGPSGCGKSTTLAAVAGLDRPQAGRIASGDKVFFDGETGHFLPPEDRNCGLVFQTYALWPHMTVRQNLQFPLRLRRISRREEQRRIDDVLALVEMRDYADRYPHELSGGQQQRVALARTLVYEPTVLLLDEPLSNLDAKLRERARTWLSEIQNRIKVTTLYVTHDQTEALALSDRIVVMNCGRIVQIGTPQDIYERPTDPFVADFIGTSSFLKGAVKTLEADGSRVRILLGQDQELLVVAPRRQLAVGTRVTIAVRPEGITLLAEGEEASPEGGARLRARIQSRSYLGARYQYHIDVGGSVVKAESSREFGDKVQLRIPVESCLVFPAEA
jgi:iron(III) transport system ATP-binding protein